MILTDADAADRAWLDVDLDALVTNARTLAARCDRPLLPMVKANGYGLGAVPVARALEAIAPWGYGVATPAEGAELRAAGISRPVVVFTPLQRGWIPTFLRNDLRPAIGDIAALEAWLAASDGRPFHVEIDTGMARAGVQWSDREALAAAAAMLHDCGGWEGAFTHFHSAESDESATEEQWHRLGAALDALGTRPPLVHAANSAGAMCGARFDADLVRPGIYIYGGEECGGEPVPAPVARVAARVVAVRQVAAGETVSYGATWRASVPTTIATLGIGYADGVPRSLSNSGVAALGERIVPFAGRVTMDMTLVDAGDVPVAVGDVATVIGGPISLAEQARRAGTISYELLTGFGQRLERRYGAAR